MDIWVNIYSISFAYDNNSKLKLRLFFFRSHDLIAFKFFTPVLKIY